MYKDPKLLLSTIMTCLMLVAWLTRARWLDWFPKRWAPIFALVLGLSRIITLLLFTSIAGRVSDNAVVISDAISKMNSGLVLYRDFSSSTLNYNPAFYYFLFWVRDGLQLSFVLSFLEILSFVALFFLLRQVLTDYQIKLWSIIYLLSPLTLWWGGIGGQTAAPVLLVFTLSLLITSLNNRQSSLWAGIVIGIGFSLTKLTTLIPLPFAVSFTKNRLHASIGVIVGIISFSPFFLMAGTEFIKINSAASQANVNPSTWVLLNFLMEKRIRLRII